MNTITSEILNWKNDYVLEISTLKESERSGYTISLYLKCTKCNKVFNYIDRITLKPKQSPAQKINEFKKMAESFANSLSDSYNSIKCNYC